MLIAHGLRPDPGRTRGLVQRSHSCTYLDIQVFTPGQSEARWRCSDGYVENNATFGGANFQRKGWVDPRNPGALFEQDDFLSHLASGGETDLEELKKSPWTVYEKTIGERKALIKRLKAEWKELHPDEPLAA